MSDENSGEVSEPPLVRQPHGGAIYQGGVPGNRGGGRPPSELKREVRGIFEESLPALREFALGQRTLTKSVRHECSECGHEETVELELHGPPRPRDQLKAIEMAGKIGLEVRVDKSLVDEVWSTIALDLPDDLRPKIKRELNRIVGRRLAEAVLR